MDIVSILITIIGTSVLTSSVMFLLINFALNRFGHVILDFFDKGIVKRGMAILGKKSGESRRNKALETEIASSVINSTIGKWKPILGVIGIDLDDLIERYGATEVLGMAQTFLPMLQNAGIDIKSLMQPTQQTQTSNKLGNI